MGTFGFSLFSDETCFTILTYLIHTMCRRVSGQKMPTLEVFKKKMFSFFFTNFLTVKMKKTHYV